MQQDGRFSVVLNLVGFGFGQAYNRQLVKGIISFVLFVVFVALLRSGILGETAAIWTFIVFYATMLIDAYRSAFTAQHRALYNERVKDIEKQAKVI